MTSQRNALSKKVRFEIFKRDSFTCQYCGDKFSTKNLTLDHVVPVSKDGPKSWTNVVAACRECNQKKANRTPDTARMPLLKEPTVPSWLPTTDLEFRAGNIPHAWIQYLQFKAG